MDERLRKLEIALSETETDDELLAWIRSRIRAGEALGWPLYSRLAEARVHVAARYLEWRLESGALTRNRRRLARICGDRATNGGLDAHAPPTVEALQKAARAAELEIRGVEVAVVDCAIRRWEEATPEARVLARPSETSPLAALRRLRGTFAAQADQDPPNVDMREIGLARGHDQLGYALRGVRALEWQTAGVRWPHGYGYLSRHAPALALEVLRESVVRDALGE